MKLLMDWIHRKLLQLKEILMQIFSLGTAMNCSMCNTFTGDQWMKRRAPLCPHSHTHIHTPSAVVVTYKKTSCKGRSAAAMLFQVRFWNIPVKDYLFPILFNRTRKVYITKPSKYTLEPRFTNAPVHEQFGLRTHFPSKKPLGWRTVSRITNTQADNSCWRQAESFGAGVSVAD
jgi:hypothetical protein